MKNLKKRKIIKILSRSLILALMLSCFISIDAFAATYTARVMQGNTYDEADCREIVNGLIDSGSYSLSNIQRDGWTYIDSDSSDINTVRATASNFLYARNYTFAYFSGHGSRSGDVPTLNCDTSAAYGTYTPFNVATTLDVDDDSSWRTDSNWTTSSAIRVLMLASCVQLDSHIMHYYARAMRASSIGAIAGYHETAPGTGTDTTIAENFFEEAIDGNSVKYSWQHANTFGSTVYPWAVLVYEENNNEYYRIPGLPGNTYTTPSSTAAVYRYRSGLTGSQVVSYTKSSATTTSDSLPLYIDVASGSDLRTSALRSFESREPVSSNDELPVNTTETDAYMNEMLSEKSLDDVICVQTPVYKDEINIETGGSVADTETVVERTYHYYNTYKGIRISDASMVFYVDAEGIGAVDNNWKEVVGSDDKSTITTSDLVDEKTALKAAVKLAQNQGYEDFNLLRSTLVYAPIADDMYKLSYELVSQDGILIYVDAETGSAIE